MKQVLNSKGEPIVLTPLEMQRAEQTQQIVNSLGYEIDITTLTSIVKKITEQKFFEVAPADYMPVRVGEGAWSTELLTYRSFALGGDFETGIVNTAANDTRLASADAGVDAVPVKVNNWAKAISWTIFDVQQASRSGNWDIVTAKERARKMNWDLGIQRVAFLGGRNNGNILGLLTQPDVNSNTMLITQYISTMDATDFAAFTQSVIADYRTNASFTAMPDRFVIPELDYNGLVAPVAAAFPVNSKLEYLEKAFKVATRNPNFKILPLAYAGQAQNSDVTGLNKNRYSLYRSDEESLRMDIPVDYTATLQNSVNNFQFENVGYGQFTGAKAYRPKEMLYFDWAE